MLSDHPPRRTSRARPQKPGKTAGHTHPELTLARGLLRGSTTRHPSHSLGLRSTRSQRCRREPMATNLAAAAEPRAQRACAAGAQTRLPRRWGAHARCFPPSQTCFWAARATGLVHTTLALSALKTLAFWVQPTLSDTRGHGQAVNRERITIYWPVISKHPTHRCRTLRFGWSRKS